MSQARIAALVTGSGSQPRFEEQERASQITARLIRNGQAHRAMRVKFPARFFNCLTALQQATMLDDLFDVTFRITPLISRNAGRAR
jgi:hypothetical protein